MAGRLRRGLVNIMFAPLLLITIGACGTAHGAGQDSTSTLLTSPKAQGDVDLNVAGVDPTSLCFGASTLPPGFAADGSGVMDSVEAANMSSDPEMAQKYMDWGRLSGGYIQWTFVAPGSQANAEGATPSKSVSQAQAVQDHEAAVNAPYVAALCRVDFYQHTSGAHQAFAAVHDVVVHSLLGRSTLHTTPDPHIATESSAYFTVGPGYGSAILAFRSGNVVGEVTVSTVCRTSGCSPTNAQQQEAVRLAKLLAGTIDDRLRVGENGAPTAGTAARPAVAVP